jgi:hypothetical protein
VAYSSLTLLLLISAPGDVGDDDLSVIRQTIDRWNFREGRRFAPVPVTVIPLCWAENAYSEIGLRPQESLNRQLVDKADLVVAMFADRLGTPTGKAESGTAEEIQRMVAAGKHVSVVRSLAARSLAGSESVKEKLRLEEFLVEMKAHHGLVYEYSHGHQLAGHLENVLSSQAEHFLRGMSALPRGGDDADAGPSDTDSTKGVWPRTELTETIGADDNGRPTTKRRWYLVLDNRTGGVVRNVTHRFETATGSRDRRFDARHTADVIQVMAPDDAQRYPLAVNFATAGQAMCVVSWEDSRGRHETRATVRTW